MTVIDPPRRYQMMYQSDQDAKRKEKTYLLMRDTLVGKKGRTVKLPIDRSQGVQWEEGGTRMLRRQDKGQRTHRNKGQQDFKYISKCIDVKCVSLGWMCQLGGRYKYTRGR